MPIFTNTDSYTVGIKLFSEACERNKEPILQVLRPALAEAQTVLEIGSGSGQHAVYFGQQMPHLTWYTSDVPVNHGSIRAWLADATLENVHPPISLNVDDAPWSLRDAGLDVASVDALFTANTLHIISWPQVVRLFAGIGNLLNDGGQICIYGPFKYAGNFTSEGDARFDEHLKSQNEGSGVRDFEAVSALAEAEGLHLVEDHSMPASNHLLRFAKSA